MTQYATEVSPATLEHVRLARIATIKALEALDMDAHPATRNALFAAYDRLGEVNLANE